MAAARSRAGTGSARPSGLRLLGASGLGRARSVVFMGAVALFSLGCYCTRSTRSHVVQGPDRVVAGFPATFTIDDEGFNSSSTCPHALRWFFDGATNPSPVRRPVKTRKGSEGCVVSNETATYTFAPGAPGTERQATVSTQFEEDEAAFFIVFDLFESVGKKTVTVVTPAKGPVGGPFGFNNRVGYLTGDRPIAVTTGNYKNTGSGNRIDVAVASNGNTGGSSFGHKDLVRVHPVNSNGTLSNTFSVNLGMNHALSDLASGRFDADTDDDLAPTITQPDTSAYLNNTGTALTNPQTRAVDSDPVGVASGRINSDNFLDLVTANEGDDDVSVLVNAGTAPSGGEAGRFLPPASYTTNGGSDPNGVAIDDFNGDNDRDIAVSRRSTGDVAVYLGQPASNSFGPLVSVMTPNPARSPRKVAVGDFNKDAKPDIAVANAATDTVSVLLNTTATVKASGGGPKLPTFSEQTLPVGDGPVDVAVGDFNGDGLQDLATANSLSDDSSVLLNGGFATFTPAISVPASVRPQSVAAGDFNGDGRADLAVANLGGTSADGTGVLTVAFAKTGTANFPAAARSRRTRPKAHAARDRAAAKRPRKARGTRVRARARLRRLRTVSRGKASYTGDGVFRVRGWLLTGELTIRYKAKRGFTSRLPRGLRRGVRARALARLDGTSRATATGRTRVIASGLVVGRVRNRPGATLCVRVRYDTASRKRSSARVLGGTGALAGFTGSGRMPLVGTKGKAQTGRLTLTVKGGRRRKLSRACRTLLRRVPKSPRKRVR